MRTLVTIPLLLAVTTPLAAQEPPSYARHVKPFLARYCIECHSGDSPKADLNLETYKALLQGGKSGSVLVPSKPDDSAFVLQVEHKAKPFMPPKTARQPQPGEVGVLRAWVLAGAKDDSAAVAGIIPEIKPRAALPPPVSALAYRPDGKLLAAGGHKEVLLVGAAGDVAGKLTGQPGKVTTLAFSRDGLHLAVATGAPGTAGEVRLYPVPIGGLPQDKPQHVLAAHRDLIYDVAFSPDGKLLATAGYDRLIKLWDIATGQEVRTLKDHSDTIYALTFSPDGKLLASAAADRAVKVWDVASGTRLYTLGDSTDWVYAAAWSPDGRHLAAGGVDRSIRVWEVSASGGKLVHSVFAHEASVLRLAYSADGKTLYSVGEGGLLKAWETAGMTERTVYPQQPEAILSFAVRPGQLALGRYDGALVLLDEQSGKVQMQPLPVKPKPPQVSKLTPGTGQRGKTIRLTLDGKDLDGAAEVVVGHPGATAKIVPEGRTPTALQSDLTFPDTTPAGAYPITLKGPGGQSAAQMFLVDLFPLVAESGKHDSPTTGQLVRLPASIVGTIDRAGAIDYYRFEAEGGQDIGVQAITHGSKLAPVLLLTDAGGRLLAESESGILGYTCLTTGTYTVGVRDREFRGGADMTYRLHVGPVPVVTSIFPMGLQRGAEADIRLQGVFLLPTRSVRVKAGDAAPGTRLPLAVQTPNGLALGAPSVVVGEFPEVVRGQSDRVPVPGTANGVIDKPGATDTWRFTAKKGQRLIIETNAHRLGSPLDSFIEVLDANGHPVPRAVLRAVAKTYVTFRDHDAAGPGIRLETWNELAMNDYLLVGDELVRILSLPRGPDDDCQFWSVNGQRVGLLDTTPVFHPLNQPMYKVTIHPPGTTFPPNGFPVVTLYYRNDDGGPGYGKDSRLFFDVPADGEYRVRVGDSAGQGGPQYGYRLTVRPPRPSFNVRFSPTSPAVWKGNAVPISVTADRFDGFDGPIEVRLENLPPGLSAPVTTIPAGEHTTAFALFAEVGVGLPEKLQPLKLVARAVIDGKEVVREAAGGVPKVVEPGDLTTATLESELTVQPGREVRVTVKVERHNGYKGRVPVDVRGLPHGVYVLDVGLNGILITEQDTTRTFVIHCEPWVKPTEHPFVVLARSERKGSEHAARSVLLKVVAPK